MVGRTGREGEGGEREGGEGGVGRVSVGAWQGGARVELARAPTAGRLRPTSTGHHPLSPFPPPFHHAFLPFFPARPP